MIEYVLIGAAIGIIAWFYHVIKSNGFLGKIEPIVTETPKNISKQLTVYYKYHVGSYANVSSVLQEARSLVPKGSTTFGIYYDNPDVVEAHLLQSAVGVVFAENGENLYDEQYSEDLVNSGFEKMVLPKVSRAVQALQPSTGGFLSFLALVNRTYGIIREFISANRLEVRYAVEFFTDSEISVEFPLDNIADFLVPDYLPTDQLESKLARKKFDSDEEDSESEPDVDEADDDEAEGDAKNQ